MNIIKNKNLYEYDFFFHSDEFVINIKEKTILRKYRLGNLIAYHKIGVEEKELISKNFYNELRILKLEKIL